MRKHLTDVTYRLYLDIIGSVEYRKELRALFQVQDLSEAHISIGSVLCLETFAFFISHVAAKVTHQYESEQVNFSV